MKSELKSRIQVFLVLMLVLAGGRVAYIFHERHAAAPTRKAEDEGRALTSDEYVVPKKFYAHDLASAKALVGKPVWVKQGYGNLVYPIKNSAPDLTRGAATLFPLERLEIKDVVLRSAPASWSAPVGESELVAICRRPDSTLVAAPIGSARNGDFHLQANDLFYTTDPRELHVHTVKTQLSP